MGEGGGELGAEGVAQRVYTVPPASLQEISGSDKGREGIGGLVGKEKEGGGAGVVETISLSKLSFWAKCSPSLF